MIILKLLLNGKKCGKGDLNSRTPTRMGSEPIAFDQTWQFPQKLCILSYSLIYLTINYLKFLKTLTIFIKNDFFAQKNAKTLR